jgi:glycosyltransferase involved in cell wall biosynthesis
MIDQPLVSIVTPFYNTAPYIAECIESVLGQTYTNFEFLLVDNKSTDGSREIAESYAARDKRIKLFHNAEFLDQLPNCNGALERIDPASRYVKMALADDVLFPECVSRMVALAESRPTAGLVAAYYLYGDRVDGSGIPIDHSCVAGRDALRLTFLNSCFLTGTPTTVLYRADIVRSRKPFFKLGLYHADTEAAYEILLEHDLGFVHQVLSFVRIDNESITRSVKDLYPVPVDIFVAVQKFAPQVLTTKEFEYVRDRAVRDYFGLLGRMALRFKERRFWDYHRRVLATMGMQLSWLDVLPWSLAEFLHIALNPENTARRALRLMRRRNAPPPAAIPRDQAANGAAETMPQSLPRLSLSGAGRDPRG